MTTISVPLPQFTASDRGPAPDAAKTTVGNYFVANYPPFGFWKHEGVADFDAALASPARAGVGLGLYAHIPFCRKRCHFCYFKVYTDKNAAQIRAYIEALLAELRGYASQPAVKDRRPEFIYFGGGTPSYLSADQLRTLTDGMKAILPWDGAREVAFEAEPGTLNEPKVHALRAMGVTRLSLGLEHFDDHVLETNGRAHRSNEILRAWKWARAAGFAQINVDLIAGMLEETDARWADTISRAIDLAPDSVTIYQMEIPYNTTIYQRMKAEGSPHAPVADWETKRRWVDRAFERFVDAGYTVATATTVVKDAGSEFLYRRGLFDGTDLLSIGVSSFGHLSGVNYQNEHNFDPYLEAVRSGRRPTYRAYALSPDERYIREFALQMKGGSVSLSAFRDKFGADPRERFAGAIADLQARGLMEIRGDRIGVTRAGLLQVDRLLYEFFRPEHRAGRYA